MEKLDDTGIPEEGKEPVDKDSEDTLKFPTLSCEPSSIFSYHIHQYVLNSQLYFMRGFFHILSGDQAYRELLNALFQDREGVFYLYTEVGGLSKSVTDRFIAFGIIVKISESSYYFNSDKDGGWFMRIALEDFIDIDDGKIPCSLEKIKCNSKHYYRHTLKLTDRMQAYLNNTELSYMNNNQIEDLVDIKPGLWGISVNLKEIAKRIWNYLGSKL